MDIVKHEQEEILDGCYLLNSLYLSAMSVWLNAYETNPVALIEQNILLSDVFLRLKAL